MNANTLTHLLQQGFHLTLGATASLVETLQDPQKRTESLSQIGSELSHLTQEWAAKGEMTEQEARDFVFNFLNQLRAQAPISSPTTTVTNTPTQVAPPEVQLDLQELTAQITAMRIELERMRDSDSSPS